MLGEDGHVKIMNVGQLMTPSSQSATKYKYFTSWAD